MSGASLSKMIQCLILVLVLFSCHSGELRGYFDKMPYDFVTDSLTFYKEPFELLETEFMNGGADVIKVFSKEEYVCSLIPFCGFLKYEDDTIYHSSVDTTSMQPFLILNAKKYTKWVVEYKQERSDEVTYMGRIFDKEKRDSVHLFQLSPVKRIAPMDATYLKFIAIEKGGIRYLSFANNLHFFTISFQQHPKVIYRE